MRPADEGTAGESPDPATGRDEESLLPYAAYSILVFLLALVALSAALVMRGIEPVDWGLALFFLGFGLFTISMGYSHPGEGYVSFDRVAQIASILVLGPVTAAWVNGLASLLFPWHRLKNGESVAAVARASLHNAGLMTLLILTGGLIYEGLGGVVPLTGIDGSAVFALLGMFVFIQVFNEIFMRISIAILRGRWTNGLDLTTFLIESSGGLAGVLVAVVMNRMEVSIVLLLLMVLSTGILFLTQFARLRLRLEAMVDARTQKLQEQATEMERLATHDKLTRLHNRRFADDYLDERLAEFHRYRRHFAIALVDLDHFKSINDTFSHNTGDRVLRRVAELLVERCRDSDMVARYGGEEFLLCFPETDVTAAREICEQLRDAVASSDWGEFVPDVAMSISAGVAGMRPGLTRMALLSEADRRLYEAKSAGRNRVI